MKKKWYIAAILLSNGEVSVSDSFDSEERMLEELKKGVMSHPEKVVATQWKVVESEKKPRFWDIAFGKFRNRDLMQDKKFLRSITSK